MLHFRLARNFNFRIGLLYVAFSILPVTLDSVFSEVAVVSPPAIVFVPAIGFPVVTPPAIIPTLDELPTIVLEPMTFVEEYFPLKIKQQGSKVIVKWKKIKAVKYSFILHSGKKIVRSMKRCRISFKAKPGIKYSLFVRVYGSKGIPLGHSKKYSLIVPKRVSGFKVRFLSKVNAELSWKPCADKYLVYRKVCGSNGTFRLLKQLKKTSFVDDTVRFNKKYRYKIIAVNKGSVTTVSSPTVISYDNSKIVCVSKQKYSYEDVSCDLRKLVKRYPKKISYSSLGKTADGRCIYDVVIGNKKAKKSLLVVATLHAREYMCSLLCMNQIEYYLGEEEFESVLDEMQIHYVVMANRDGVSLSQFGIDAIESIPLGSALSSMSVSTLWKANGRGVDLNRNFPYDFQESGFAGAAGYSGTTALSERESQAIVSLVDELRSGVGLCGVVNYHATGSIIFGDCEKKKNSSLFKQTTQMYETAVSLTGYTSAQDYNSGSSGSAGNFREFVMYQCGIPSITIEIGKQSCPLPISEFTSIWEKNKLVVIEEAKLFL